jgi:predicted phosphodiesterase
MSAVRMLLALNLATVARRRRRRERRAARTTNEGGSLHVPPGTLAEPGGMRRVAAIYDVHGNLPALDAVLWEIQERDVERVVVGGDVAAGPMPVETLELLVQLDCEVLYVRGNADRELVAAYDRCRRGASQRSGDAWRQRSAWAASKLGGGQRDLLASFRQTVVLDIDGLGEVVFCHGTPRSDEEIMTAVSSVERLSEILADVPQGTVVCGHTHHQFDRVIGDKRVVNAGSVGMPYEGRGGVACWALLGPGVVLCKTAYDWHSAAEQIRRSGIPAAEQLIAELEHPPSADEVAQFFEDIATRASNAQ